MKNLAQRSAFIILLGALVTSLASTAAAQPSCSAKSTFVGSGPSGEWSTIFNNYCNSTKTQYQFTGTIYGNVQVVAQNAARRPDGRIYSEIGGKTSCSVFEKEIVITFSEPVADLVLIVSRALTATDNRGYSVSYDSPTFFNQFPNQVGWYARFPGTGITSVTITNPVYWKFSPSDTETYWMMSVDWGSFVQESLYKQCNCGAPTIQTPPPRIITSSWLNDITGTDPNWSMKADVSEKDGLVLRDITLGQR